MDTLPNKQAHPRPLSAAEYLMSNFIIHIISFHKMLCQTNLQFCMIAGNKIACAALRNVLCNDAQGCNIM